MTLNSSFFVKSINKQSKTKLAIAVTSALFIFSQSVQAKEFIGLNDDDLIQYDSRNDLFINHETNEVIPVKDIDGLRTFETTFNEPIKDYDINFGQWTEVHEFPFDKAILHFNEDMTLTNGNHLWVIDTDQIVEMHFADGKEIYGEFDPNKYYGNGIITPDNTVGFTLNVDAIRLKVLDGYMEDQCGAIATRGNGWAPAMEPNSGTYINTKLLDIVSENTVSSPDKTAIFVYNNLFNINADEINIHSTNEETRFGNGILSANSQSNITVDTMTVDAEAAIIAQDPMKNGDPSNLNITGTKITLNGAIQTYGGNLTFKRDINRPYQKVEVIVNEQDAVTSNTADYPDKVAEKNQSVVTFDINTVISSQGDDKTYANKSGIRTASAIRAMRNSVYYLNADTQKYEIYGDVIAGRGNETTTAPGGKINIGGLGSIIRGDVLAGNTGTINIELNDGSLEGRIDDYNDATLKDMVFRPEEFDVAVSKGGTVNLNLNNSTWTARGQSFVSEINFGEAGGVIDLIKDNANSVTIRNLKGNGTFNIKLNADEHEKGHMLYIGRNEGNQTVNIIGGIEGLESINEDNPLRFATVGIDGASLPETGGITGTKIRAFTRDAGVWDLEYIVAKEKFDKEDGANEDYNGEGDGEGVNKPGNNFVEEELVGERDSAVNWIITGYKPVEQEPEEPDTPDTPDIDNPDVPSGPSGTHISDAGKTIINMSRANYANAVYMDTLNKRQGEARFVSDTDHGVWVRLRHDNIGKEDAFRSHNTMVEVGIDQRDVHDYGEFHTGVALDYMNGSLDYHTVDGDGDIERYGIWFYTTYLGNDGQYADLILKYGHLKNDFGFNTKTQGEHVTGDYTNETASISAEYGWKFSNSHNYYIEPQAQLQYTYITGADYTTSQGSRVDLDSIHSLIGRVGFRAGKDFLDWEHPASFYLRADALHEFLGDQDIRAYDNTGVMDITYENDDTWYTVGLGMTVKSSDNTYFFIEGETALGADNEDTYTVSGGFRHSF